MQAYNCLPIRKMMNMLNQIYSQCSQSYTFSLIDPNDFLTSRELPDYIFLIISVTNCGNGIEDAFAYT